MNEAVMIVERRRIAVLGEDQRFDIAVPLNGTLGEALMRFGFEIAPGLHAVVDRGGNRVDVEQLGAEFEDGALFTIVTLRRSGAANPHRGERGRPAVSTTGTTATGVLWWLIGVVAVIAGAVVFIGGDDSFVGESERILAGAVLGGGAVAAAVVWAFRRPSDSLFAAAVMVAPVALAFVAGAAVIPLRFEAGAQLAVITGLLTAGLVAIVIAVAVHSSRLRSIAKTSTTILLWFAACWGLALLMGWESALAAAISVGSVPLVWRFLPTTLVPVAEGYHIEYDHFMSNRWAVRDVIPQPPGPVQFARIETIVADSSARLLTGTVLLSAASVFFVPIFLARPVGDDLFVRGGTIAVVACLVIALVLIPRHTAAPILRWVPRAAAAFVLFETAIVVQGVFTDSNLLAAASGMLALGIVAAVVLVPISHGASSLTWSRIADFFETLSVALSFPAALLAVDILNVLRGVMS